MKKLVVRESDEIRPAKPISPKDIQEVLTLHREVMSSLDKAFQIGFKLRCWHDLMPNRGDGWPQWCERNIPQIHKMQISRYIRLWDHNEEIRAKMKVSSEDTFSIERALELVGSKSRKLKNPKSKKPEPKLEAKLESKPPEPKLEPEPKSEPEPEAEKLKVIEMETGKRLCPTCGKPLTKKQATEIEAKVSR